MASDRYLRLYDALNDSRFDDDEVRELVARLGPTGQVIRGLARARRHAWASARADLRAAVAAPDLAPVVELVAGVGLFVARDYDLAVTTLARAAARGKPGVAKHAQTTAQRLTAALGWVPEPADGDVALERDASDLATIAARVRLDLRAGRIEAAAERLAALEPELRERLSGERAALALSRGQANEAIVRTTHHRDDPRLLYLRGRALLALAEPAEAAELFERARATLPDSVAIGLALALARHHEAPHDYGEALERRFEELLERAPALLSDAAAELGLGLWTDRGLLDSRADKVAIATRAQQLLTADADVERASYRKRGGSLRVVPPTTPGQPTPLARLHADDRAWIDQVDALLVRALGVTPRRPDSISRHDPAGGSAPWRPRAMSPAEIEQFMIDGYVVLRGAFDPAIAKAWREDANRRIRDEPERWVRGYDPNDASKLLTGYSPADPSTWTWPRIDLVGEQTVRIEQFAPHAWAVICDLLGGPDRIKTRSWNNYLIINFCADVELGVDVPGPSWNSWHIDDPNPVTRIDRIHNGLVGIALHDRVLPRSGNTWVAPESVALVARELAKHPAGVDFVRRRGAWITEQCQRFDEVVGEAGDLFLLHPLLMHSASPNRSGRIRWMSNPMVYLERPLDPFRPLAELSPVELAIHRAIRQ